MSTTELKVTWEEPFTFESFPILDYNITVYNSSTPNDSHTYTVTDHSKLIRINTETDTCSLLRFEVTARNEIDKSRVGITSGGFPVGEFKHVQTAAHVYSSRRNLKDSVSMCVLRVDRYHP